MTNFKSFVDSAFELSPLTLVLGSNAAGKSNFFDALRFLRYMGAEVSIRDAIEGHTGATPTEEPILGIRGGRQELPHFRSGSTVAEVFVDIATQRGEIHYQIAVDVATFRVVMEELRADFHPGPYVFSTHPEVDPPTHDPESPGLSARFYKNQRGTRPKREFNPAESILSQFEGRRAESTLNEEIARITRSELAGITPLELRPEVLRAYSRLGNFQLGEHGENFAAVVWALTNEFAPNGSDSLETVYSWLSELTPQRIAEVGAQDAPTGDVIFALREEAYDRWISARSLSDGTLRYVALTFALFGGGERRTFAIEELENGINPTRMGLLLRMLEASTSDGAAGVQVLASTHSPQLLGQASPETVQCALIIGWDADRLCSRVSLLRDLPNLAPALAESTIDELQAEGWLQFAADA